MQAGTAGPTGRMLEVLEVLEGRTAPLLLSLSELGRAGSGGFASLWGKFYEIRRVDNDPGKPTH
ncbi:MAG TPA: hypothetical protein VFJ94_08205 [Intrasporangium sp.]|uniref:hypothetical protein n=1 Tax=Intrasporangium sp. TaxID=1925024 RepID=UPI002D794F55|nr:hypothetical protein [Intrasporangium sp.]HET7398492.1 hypothetical protein [Intrasporangium sp.]